MSLDISVWVPDEDAYAGRGGVENPPDTSTGVGAENFRHLIWGSAAARSLGATFLPQLADITEENRGQLEISPGRLDAFEQECRLLERNVDFLSAETIRDRDRILHYLANMNSAIHRAKAVGGGVIIW
ncbi:hypothetical protein Q0Z83_012020 [Actinoplanes sichuanensis]|uniref:Uncharacterized protein n=1 Tax=Actinoplanes sichuanensis TaxID=512349 RepID=A0ABW4A4M4_9ACTN|nr:hypothetical protein [Actinoplanes sichuanensis]BEL03011.1 hypothetical protein Q0Z83_012020 [Actinoplanes sichuanensis]